MDKTFSFIMIVFLFFMFHRINYFFFRFCSLTFFTFVNLLFYAYDVYNGLQLRKRSIIYVVTVFKK